MNQCSSLPCLINDLCIALLPQTHIPKPPPSDSGVQAFFFLPSDPGLLPSPLPTDSGEQASTLLPQTQNLSLAEAGGRAVEQELLSTVFIPGDVTQEGDLQVSVFCPTLHRQSLWVSMPLSAPSFCPLLSHVFRNDQDLNSWLL